jgi:hypothetical protein
VQALQQVRLAGLERVLDLHTLFVQQELQSQH